GRLAPARRRSRGRLAGDRAASDIRRLAAIRAGSRGRPLRCGRLLGKLGLDRRLGRRLVSPRGGGMAAVPHRRHHTPAGADRPFGDRRSRGRRWRHHHSLRWALADARQRRRHHAARRGPCGHDDLCRGRRGRRALDRRLAGEADRSRHELRDPRRVRTRERGLVRRLRGHARGGLAPRKRARRSVGNVLADPPLSGVRVLEVGNYMAGPFCGMQLADLGAEVIKIEQPDGGDQVRLTGPFLDGESSPFVRLNRNKRSLVLDLKSAAGKEIFKRLAVTADVVVENLRPGTMKDLGLDYQGVLSGLNAGLVYVAASGWGQDGPLSPLAGLDIMAQARSGLMSITGEPDGDPVKIGVPMCDLVCALYGALAAVSALRVRDRTGQGQFIDVSLLEAGVSFAVWEAARYWATGEIPKPLGSAHQNNAPYQAVKAADGYFTLGATSRRNWEAFCQALGLEEVLDD